MSLVVCVHGIGQQLENDETLAAKWRPPLVGSVRAAGVDLAADDVRCASYGGIFRPQGRHLGVGDEMLDPDDLAADEEELLQLWWGEAARTDPSVLAPDARALGTARTVQAALRALSGSRFFASLAQRAMLSDLRQVRLYLTDPEVRHAARTSVADLVSERTRVIVGHSLGSVVAYEVMCAHEEWGNIALVTIGSPLAIANLMFDKLDPAPDPPGREPRGRWPGSATAWTNLSDQADVVALVKDLRPAFGPRVENYVIDNGAHAHDVRPYLTAVETGEAVAAALRA